MIRLAEKKDLKEILVIYETARKNMRENGNPSQWGDQYPPKELVTKDIENQCLYVCVRKNRICGVFALIFGEDTTYHYIEDGKWKNEKPYATIHRLAKGQQSKGIFRECLEFCKDQIGNLRADTHHDNLIMQYLLEKNGFEKCGIIYLANGSKRIAYQFYEEETI